MVGITPSKIAMLFLKVNVLLFAITLGSSLIGLFPYYMHINQVANNIALDVANKNYTNKDELILYVEHLTKSMGDRDANTYSLLTFKESDIRGRVHSRDNISQIEELMAFEEATAFADPLDVERNDFYEVDHGGGGNAIVAVSVKPLEGHTTRSMIVGDGSFDPLNNNADIVRGINGEPSLGNNSILVQRGTPFKVEVKTRYKLTGGVFGFMLHSGLPVKAETVGVTTKYYQYGG